MEAPAMNGWLDRRGVCFTGKGMLDGKLVTRDILDRVVRAQGGIHYETYSGQIDILVSSRTDTSKWDKAINAGKHCITYDEFWQMLGVTTHAELHQLIEDNDWDAQRAARLREQEEAQARVQAKRDAFKAAQEARERQLAEAEATIPGWGTF
jgi:hypothetical protein